MLAKEYAQLKVMTVEVLYLQTEKHMETLCVSFMRDGCE